MSRIDQAAAGGKPTTSDDHRAAGHWLLAKMGKKVLRPGGLALTQSLLNRLNPTTCDRVVELGPGVGATAELILAGDYASYTGVEPNPDARTQIDTVISGHHDASIREGDGSNTGLCDRSVDLVISEAMLTMQSAADKVAIANEVFRVLGPNGRWGLHELCYTPDSIDPALTTEISKALARSIKVGARPLTTQGWCELLIDAGFEIEWSDHAPMKLLDPTRLVADEGLASTLRFIINVARNKDARKRIMTMRRVFHANQDHLAAVAVVARKP